MFRINPLLEPASIKLSDLEPRCVRLSLMRFVLWYVR